MRCQIQLLLVAFGFLPTVSVRAQTPNGTPLSDGRRANVPVDSQAIVLLPFTVRTPSSLAYLSDGIIDLLQNAIEGAGKYHVVSPLVAAPRLRAAGNPRTGVSASAIARELGARLTVGGSLVAIGGEVTLTTELYDAVAKRRVVPLSARGELATLGRMVDSLAAVMSDSRRVAKGPSATQVPWGALDATKTISRNQSVLVADLEAIASDSSLARTTTDALRMGLDRSAFFRVMAPRAVAGALQRMRRERTERVTPDLARQIAEREQVVAVVEGSLVRRNPGFLLKAQLVSVDSGRLLAVVSAAAADVDGLTDAADEVSRRLRAKVGESLKALRESPTLAKVTTASVAALDKYTIGARAFDAEQDAPKAVTFLRHAVALDSSFAMAWRKLAVVYASSNLAAPGMIDDAMERAFRLRGNLPDDERLIAEASYYGMIGDRGKAISAYEERFLRRPNPTDSTGFNNLADALLSRREYARSEALSRATINAVPNIPLQYGSLISALIAQRKLREADSVATLAARRFPQFAVLRAEVTCRLRSSDDCDRALEAVREQSSPQLRIRVLGRLEDRALLHGQLSLADRLHREARVIDSIRGGFDRSGPGDVWRADGIDAWIRGDPTPIAARLDSMKLALGPWRGSAASFHLSIMAAHFSWGRRPDRARAMLDELKSIVPDSEMRPTYAQRVRDAQWEIALAEQRWTDAMVARKAAALLPDGPRDACENCVYYDFGVIYDRAGMRDSAVAAYEHFVSGPDSLPFDWVLPSTYERLCALGSETGHREKMALYCAKFVDMWKNADPELQPRVEAARARLGQVRAAPGESSGPPRLLGPYFVRD